MKEGLNMLKDLDVAKVLIEAFDNDETGILLYDKKDKLCFANKPMFTRFNSCLLYTSPSPRDGW